MICSVQIIVLLFVCLSCLMSPLSCYPAVLSSNHREALLDKESEMSSLLEKLRLKEAEILRMREDEAHRASYLQSAILTYVQGSPLGHYSSPKKWPGDLSPSVIPLIPYWVPSQVRTDLKRKHSEVSLIRFDCNHTLQCTDPLLNTCTFLKIF